METDGDENQRPVELKIREMKRQQIEFGKLKPNPSHKNGHAQTTSSARGVQDPMDPESDEQQRPIPFQSP